MVTTGRGAPQPTGYTGLQISHSILADLLDEEETFEFIAGAIADSRAKSPRHPDDRDSGDVLEDVIAALRASN